MRKKKLLVFVKNALMIFGILDFYGSILVRGQSDMMGTDYKPHVENKLIQLSLG